MTSENKPNLYCIHEKKGRGLPVLLFVQIFLLFFAGTITQGKRQYRFFEIYAAMQNILNAKEQGLTVAQIKILSRMLDAYEIFGGILILLTGFLFLHNYWTGIKKEKIRKAASVILWSGMVFVSVVMISLIYIVNWYICRCYGEKMGLEVLFQSGLMENTWVIFYSFFFAIITLLFVLQKNLYFLFYPLLLGIFVLLFHNGNYYFISMLMVVFSLASFLMMAERRLCNSTRELVVIAVMSALAVVSRCLFYMIPQVKPMGAVIVLTGAVYGSYAGFLTGMFSALVSNFIFGQGPWTPWQMLAFGIVGALSGALWRKRSILTKKSRFFISIIGCILIWFVYGIVMDTASVLMVSNGISKNAFRLAYYSGFIYNGIHGAATFAFLWLLSSWLYRKMNRITRKYGVF